MESKKQYPVITLKDTINWLAQKSIEEKIEFSEVLLREITVMNRAIWMDEKTSDQTKIECFKWSNELVHRIWNLILDFRNDIVEDAEVRLSDEVHSYAKQSRELAGHLAATMQATVDRYIVIENNRNGK